MQRTNFSLRLLPSLLKAAQRVAERENCSVNQLIIVALVEKLANLDRDYIDERKRQGAESIERGENPFRGVRSSAPPQEGDELPEDLRKRLDEKIGARKKALGAGQPLPEPATPALAKRRA